MKRFRLLIILIAVIAAAALLTCAFTVNAGGTFPDIREGAWYYPAVMRLYKTGVVNGFDDGNFHPDGTLTAAQFIKMLFYDTAIAYKDGEEWWRPYYEAGVEAGIINDSIITEAVMDSPLDRYHTALLLNSLGIVTKAPEGFKAVPDTETVRAAIADIDDMPQEYQEPVISVYAAGIINGYEDGKYHGDDVLTRAQAAQIMMRLYDESLRSPVVKFINIEDQPVGDEWFSDALIIGNSLAGGLAGYGGLTDATIYYCNGVSVYNAHDEEFTRQDGAKMSITDALGSGTYSKVILIFGTNEMAAESNYFYEKYCAFIDEIRKYQPDADIYIHDTPPVNEAMVQYPGSFNNANVLKTNEVLSRIANDKGLYVIDIYSLFADEDGELPSEATSDGIHFNIPYYETWAEYIKTAVK